MADEIVLPIVVDRLTKMGGQTTVVRRQFSVRYQSHQNAPVGTPRPKQRQRCTSREIAWCSV